MTVELLKPQYDPNEDISYAYMSYDDFASLPECFVQRDTEGRLNRAKKHLKTLLPEHCIVFLAELTKEDVVEGKTYPAGYVCRLDSNTRALNWSLGGSDRIPSRLLAITFHFDSMERIKMSYNTFDSADAVERTNEKVYGIITGMYRYQPVSDKLKKGQIATGLSQACQLYYPDDFDHNDHKPAVMAGMVGAFFDEIKALDPIMTRKEMWNQTWIASALLMLKHHGCDNEVLLEGLKDLDYGVCDIGRTRVRSGITHITNEWNTNQFFPQKGTTRQLIRPQISFVCYWLDKHMTGQSGSKVGRNWDTFAEDLRNTPRTPSQLPLEKTA